MSATIQSTSLNKLQELTGNSAVNHYTGYYRHEALKTIIKGELNATDVADDLPTDRHIALCNGEQS
jgi:hypothetical protein